MKRMRNKSLLMTIAIMIIAMSNVAQSTGAYTDSRDGKIYKTVKIGSQTWMAENLAFKKSNCYAYNNDSINIAKYGYLYTWETAKLACPKGWHLPTNAEWIILTDYLGGASESAGKKLKSINCWAIPNTETSNSSGFTALPGGYRGLSGTFDFLGSNGSWWSSTESNTSGAWVWGMCCNSSNVYRNYVYDANSFSVRCIKDN